MGQRVSNGNRYTNRRAVKDTQSPAQYRLLQGTEAVLTESPLCLASQQLYWGLLQIAVMLQDNNLCSRRHHAGRAVKEGFPRIAFCHPGSAACGQMDRLILTNQQWGQAGDLCSRQGLPSRHLWLPG